MRLSKTGRMLRADGYEVVRIDGFEFVTAPWGSAVDYDAQDCRRYGAASLASLVKSKLCDAARCMSEGEEG